MDAVRHRNETSQLNEVSSGRQQRRQQAISTGVSDLVFFLFQKVTGGEFFRTGAWGGKNGTLWAHCPTMTGAVEAASDHAAIYADMWLRLGPLQPTAPGRQCWPAVCIPVSRVWLLLS